MPPTNFLVFDLDPLHLRTDTIDKVFQRVAVRCSVMQCDTVCSSVLQLPRSVLQ